MLQQWILASIFPVIFICIISPSLGQTTSAQNIETFYPIQTKPQPVPVNNPAATKPLTPPTQSQQQQQQQQQLPAATPAQSSSKSNVAKAVAATAASTLAIAGLFFFMVHRHTKARRRSQRAAGSGSGGGERELPLENFSRFNGDLKEMIVDENGLDVIYWRKLEGTDLRSSFQKEAKHPQSDEKDEKEMIQNGEISRNQEPTLASPLPRRKFSISHNFEAPDPTSAENAFNSLEKAVPPIQQSIPLPPPPPPQLPPLQKVNNAVASPPPPVPPPFPPPRRPPPAPKAERLALSLKPPSPQAVPEDKGKLQESSSLESKVGNANAQVKLKPLHWDKVNINTEHSMVWHKLDDGSFRFDGDLMEALFGYVATDRRSPQKSTNSRNSKIQNSGPSGKIFILDPKKSQNTAIVLRSIAIPRKEIYNALLDGQGLDVDTLDKLTKLIPTKQEISHILTFEGDPTRLADAESFLFHLLKEVPSAISRLKAMLFRLNYSTEMLHLKEFLETLELACRELRTHKLFFKLLEAVLKAGNYMNAGTARGNAQAFKLTALHKLSDVKSIDGKTTLLHFVVEEVIRAEGKRCAVNRSHSLSCYRSLSSSSSSSSASSKQERDNEYITLGLPLVGGLSTEFINVNKAANIDRDSLINSCSALASQAREIQKLLAECAHDGTRGAKFAREMERFSQAAEEEIKEVRAEQRRVMEIVKRTTEYYQAGAWNDKEAETNPLQLFAIVRDFLIMVDRACVDVARNLQRRKAEKASSRNDLEKSLALRMPVKFPNLPVHFVLHRLASDSSDTDDDF